jgi:polyisoprenoid-binding protein YceI
MKWIGYLLSALTFAAAPASAWSADQYTLDKPHTQIMFSVDHLGYSHSHGRFLGYEGHITFDHVHPENSSVEVIIHTSTVDMGDPVWNEATKKYFRVDQFPDMTFKSTGITVLPDKRADITGGLTLLGVTKLVTLHVVMNKEGRNFLGKYVAGFTSSTDIKRSDFGMKDGLPFVGDNVHIDIEVESDRLDQPGQTQYNQ